MAKGSPDKGGGGHRGEGERPMQRAVGVIKEGVRSRDSGSGSGSDSDSDSGTGRLQVRVRIEPPPPPHTHLPCCCPPPCAPASPSCQPGQRQEGQHSHDLSYPSPPHTHTRTCPAAAHHHAPQPLPHVSQVRGQRKHSHDLRGHRDVEAGRALLSTLLLALAHCDGTKEPACMGAHGLHGVAWGCMGMSVEHSCPRSS